MVIICRENQGAYDPLIIPRNPANNLTESNFLVSSEWYTIDACQSGYNITATNEYVVYGILAFKNQVRFLIADDNNEPGFFPENLFSIKEHTLPFDWEVNKYCVDCGTIFCIGYPELCEEYGSLVRILEGHSGAIEDFLAYKSYIASIDLIR